MENFTNVRIRSVRILFVHATHNCRSNDGHSSLRLPRAVTNPKIHGDASPGYEDPPRTS